MIPLVMVHGFMGGSAQWDAQKEAIEPTCDVIALDLPGFGNNAHLPVINTIGGFADWVIGELHNCGITRFHLLGHSMGGMIVQEIAQRIPDQIDKLILYSTGPVGVLPGRFETIAESKSRAQTDGAQATARRIPAGWFLHGQAAPAYEACAAIAEQAGLDAILAGLSAMENWTGKAHLAALKPKTLVIWGDGDRTYNWQQIECLWQTIPNTNLCVFPNCAHAVHLENPEGFNSELIKYLAEG
ncbi:alpha/beta fold hydrolase [Yoonia sp. SDW83-1]|uniref:alpha/beta fold hydrolase n=1 Tax=Yoonia sp. SDW83-1 TaxID=3366945 RepID=UPI00398C59F6